MNAKSPLLAVLAACLFLAVPSQALEDKTAPWASFAVKKQAVTSLFSNACAAGRALGICADAEGPSRSLSLSVLKGIGSLSPKVSTNKFFQLVKLFIDDLEVASIGNTRIRLSIELR